MRRSMCLRVLFLSNMKMSEQISLGNLFISRFFCLLVFFFLLSINMHAQIIFEKEYPLENIQYFYSTDNDGVFVNYTIYSSFDTILLYNDNHQLIRTIKPPDDSLLSIINVSKYLFNDDDLFEIIYVYQAFENGDRHYNTHIIDENSKLLERFDDQFMWIMATAEGAKLISQGGVKIYDLPGINYPVNKGEKGTTGAKGVPGLTGPEGPQGLKGDKGDPGILVLKSEIDCPQDPLTMPLDESIYLSDPYPNPSQNNSTVDFNISSVDYNSFDYSTSFLIFYDITGIQKLRLMLQSSAGSLEINKSLLGTGTFLFRIESKKGFSTLKKLIFE